MISPKDNDFIRSCQMPECYVCGTKGIPIYRGLQDRLFGASGHWDMKKCPSPDCGILWLDPMPTREDIAKAYRSYFTHEDAPKGSEEGWPPLLKHAMSFFRSAREQGYLANRYGYHRASIPSWKRCLGILLYLRPNKRANVEASVMHLPAVTNGRLLEVGCGSGRTLKRLQDLGWEVEGVDFDPEGVRNAQSKGVRVKLGTLESQKYPEHYFDAIILSHLIEHVHDPLGLLKECHRILKANGRLVGVTPNNESLGHRMFGANWRGLEPPRHLHIFSIKSLRTLVLQAGFNKATLGTTFRGAKKIFAASDAIRHSYHTASNHPQRSPVRAWMRMMRIVEWAMMKIKPNVGEEIILRAMK